MIGPWNILFRQGFIQSFSTGGGGSISATVQPPTLYEVWGGGGACEMCQRARGEAAQGQGRGLYCTVGLHCYNVDMYY